MVNTLQRYSLLFISSLIILMFIVFIRTQKEFIPTSPKINGVSFVAPSQPVSAEVMLPIKHINSNWVAITPYAFSRANEPTVRHSYDHQWWGERVEGVKKTIEYAHDLKIKVMLKPHVWVRGQGWAGDYTLSSQEEWDLWYHDYSDYILTYAKLAEKMRVELFCIGTEYRKATTLQTDLWIKLISEIRKVYTGKLTYAANWDNYQKISFWDKLDYIGIDAYFPLNSEKTPKVNALLLDWKAHKSDIEALAKQYNTPILFTEFGYESRDYAADGHWKYDIDTLSVNLNGQTNAYQAIYQSFWNESWFMGGFLWKWHANHENSGGLENKHFTPQNKPVELIIKKHYSSFEQKY